LADIFGLDDFKDKSSTAESNIKSLTSALDEYKEGGKISADTYASLSTEFNKSFSSSADVKNQL